MATQRRPYPSGGSAREQIEWRLAFDLAWCCTNLVKIRDRDHNLVPFKFNAVQRWVYWNILDFEKRGMPLLLWILKGRQFGITTMFAIRLFLLAVFHHKNCVLIMHKEKDGQTVFQQKVEPLRKMMPVIDGEPLVPKPDSSHTGDFMVWTDPEGLTAEIRRESGENEDASVSGTFQHHHWTEMPLWKNARHTCGVALPTVKRKKGSTSSIVGEFTARAEGDYVHETWLEAEAGESAFRGLFLAWYWHEEYKRPREVDDRPFSREELEYRAMVQQQGVAYPLIANTLDLKPEFAAIQRKRPLCYPDFVVGFRLTDEQLLWRRDELKAMRGDIGMFRREYPAHALEAFQSSGRRVIPPQVCDRMDLNARELEEVDRGEYESHRGGGMDSEGRPKAKRVFVRRDDGRVIRWEKPKAKARYIIDADPASGVGRDFCAAHVLKVEYRKITVVASFRGKERPWEFARIVARMSAHYKSHAERLRDGKLKGGRLSMIVVEANKHGTNVIYELTESLGMRNLWRHDKRGVKDNWGLGHDYGFIASEASKMPMLNHLGRVLHDEELIVPDVRTRREIRGLQYLDDFDEKAGAAPGAWDDMAMACGEGVWVATTVAEFRRLPPSMQRSEGVSTISAH